VHYQVEKGWIFESATNPYKQRLLIVLGGKGGFFKKRFTKLKIHCYL